MKTTTHYRCNRHIINVTQEMPVNASYDSINQAKKVSFKLQMNADGALGRGTVALA